MKLFRDFEALSKAFKALIIKCEGMFVLVLILDFAYGKVCVSSQNFYDQVDHFIVIPSLEALKSFIILGK